MLKHALVWLLCLLLSLVVSPAFVGAEHYRASIVRQMEEASRWYGAREVERLRDGTDQLYRALVHGSGVEAFVRTSMSPRERPSPQAQAIWSKPTSAAAESMRDYWPAFLLGLYHFLLRLYHGWIWCLYLTPFLVAVTFDGFMRRKTKLRSFRYTSPTLYNAAWHAIIAGLAASLVYFAWAFDLSLFFFPIALTGMGFLVRLLISNVQASV